MDIIKVIVILLAAYLLGSLNFSVFLSRRLGADIRTLGSGNAGATNMARCYGIWAGVAVLGFDVLKAAAAMALGLLVAGEPGLAAAGIGCVLGHCFPILHRFQGGKAVSVGAVAAFFIDWRMGVAALAVFGLVVLLSKKVSLASISAAVTALVLLFLLRTSVPKTVLTLFAALMLILRHKDNVGRLMNGTEKDFQAKKRD